MIDFSKVITTEDKESSLQESRSKGVNAERDRRLSQGAVVNVTGYGDIPLQGRERDQINTLALKDTAKDLVDANVTTAVIPFRDAENTLHILTATQVIDMANKGKTAASAIYQASWDLKGTEGGIPSDYTDDIYWP